jgi:hypothetical protein
VGVFLDASGWQEPALRGFYQKLRIGSLNAPQSALTPITLTTDHLEKEENDAKFISC